jgi:menaquinone-specific isochorismate synthase
MRPVPGGDLLDHLGVDGFAWLTPDYSFVTAGVAARVPVGTGPERFERAAVEVAALLGRIPYEGPLRPGTPAMGPIAVGALPFEEGSPGELIVPALVVGRGPDGRGWVTKVGSSSSPAFRLSAPLLSPPEGFRAKKQRRPLNGAPVLDRKEHPSREEWTQAVRRALSAIHAGELEKVVLAREVTLEAPAPFDRRQVLERLRRSHPSCFTYAAGSFVGSSPELLVGRRGDEVFSRPMAGTVARGATPTEDDRLAGALQRSPKEAEEHALLVEAVLDALTPVCVGPPTAAPAEVVRLATVSHLATLVAGRLRPPAPCALALAGLLHPTPAVGGIPRHRALRTIAELEGFHRGVYAGPVGWVDAAGDGEWAVALRGAELDGSRARLVAGAGIVAGSDPAAEWAETEAKLQTMLRAVGAS